MNNLHTKPAHKPIVPITGHISRLVPGSAGIEMYPVVIEHAPCPLKQGASIVSVLSSIVLVVSIVVSIVSSVVLVVSIVDLVLSSVDGEEKINKNRTISSPASSRLAKVTTHRLSHSLAMSRAWTIQPLVTCLAQACRHCRGRGACKCAESDCTMAVLPQSYLEQIEFFEQRIAAWGADPTAIGLTAEQVADLTPLVGVARASYNAAQAARIASKDATVTFHSDTNAMAAFGRGLIKEIKAFAQSSGDESVYSKASIPPPAAPEPAGPPDTPTDVQGFINGDGAVELSWKGTLAYSTFYEILRKVDDETTWNLIASVGEKSYIDNTIASGCIGVSYRIRAKRGNQTSSGSDPITIRLGVEPENTSLNIAA